MLSPTHQKDTQNRHEHHSKNQRAEHGKRHCLGKRAKGLAFNALQSEKRKKDNDNNKQGEDNGTCNLSAGSCHNMNKGFIRINIRQRAISIFHHYNETIHKETKSDCQPCKEHKISRNTKVLHKKKGKSERKRDCSKNYDTWTKTAEHNQLNDYDKDNRFL